MHQINAHLIATHVYIYIYEKRFGYIACCRDDSGTFNNRVFTNPHSFRRCLTLVVRVLDVWFCSCVLHHDVWKTVGG